MQKHCNASRSFKHVSLTATHFFCLYMCLFSDILSYLCCVNLLVPYLLLSPASFLLSDFTRRSPVSIRFFLPGEAACKHMFKIPLCNLVGRSIERPLKSPLVNKVLTTPAPTMVPPTPLISATHSLSLSRMEIKEIASRTRKELLGKNTFICIFGLKTSKR